MGFLKEQKTPICCTVLCFKLNIISTFGCTILIWWNKKWKYLFLFVSFFVKLKYCLNNMFNYRYLPGVRIIVDRLVLEQRQINQHHEKLSLSSVCGYLKIWFSETFYYQNINIHEYYIDKPIVFVFIIGIFFFNSRVQNGIVHSLWANFVHGLAR